LVVAPDAVSVQIRSTPQSVVLKGGVLAARAGVCAWPWGVPGRTGGLESGRRHRQGLLTQAWRAILKTGLSGPALGDSSAGASGPQDLV